MLRECTSTEALENPTGEFDLTEHDPVNPSSQTPTQALQRDPVAITRNIANTIRSSQLRREEFREIVTTGNRRERWLDAQQVSYQLAHLTLIRDSPTQWGSSYLMIERALYLRQAIEVYISPPVMSTIFKQRLTNNEWAVLKDIKNILEPAHALQAVMCTEHTPILACILPAFDSLLSTWTRMRKEPSNAHLRRMIDAAVEKMTSQYNERRFSKPHIISIGMWQAVTKSIANQAFASPSSIAQVSMDRKKLASQSGFVC
ncbi:hypothetical protein JB92DRAFT_2730090 [Gautieria morchelliformis]|nr:hypothetical protein JB92DRAFT_2730090 [Gautieria morchelliformis]